MFYILFTYFNFILLFFVIYIGLSIRYTKQCKQRQQIGDTSHDCKFRFMSVRSKYRTGPTHQRGAFGLILVITVLGRPWEIHHPGKCMDLILLSLARLVSGWVVARRSSWSWASYGPVVGRLMTLLHVRSLEEPQRKRLGAAMLRLLYPPKVAGNPALPWIWTKTLPPTGQSRCP